MLVVVLQISNCAKYGATYMSVTRHKDRIRDQKALIQLINWFNPSDQLRPFGNSVLKKTLDFGSGVASQIAFFFLKS
jgi:hypothetical protein